MSTKVDLTAAGCTFYGTPLGCEPSVTRDWDWDQFRLSPHFPLRKKIIVDRFLPASLGFAMTA